MGMFRELKAEEIEVRVSRVTNAGVELLLFKDARCDMRILDETVGAENWQCEYYEHKNTLFCKVGLFTDYARGPMWVWKSNAGAPSNMEAQKGEASDAFKRACFCWGIGRSLYTAPRIFVYADKCGKIQQGKNGKMQCYDRFHVEKVRIEDGQITGLSIWNDTTGHRCFVWQKGE
jgi:hypothetical protein